MVLGQPELHSGLKNPAQRTGQKGGRELRREGEGEVKTGGKGEGREKGRRK